MDLKVADFHLSGRLSTVNEFGCIHIRYARRRVQDLLKAWIYHLVYCQLAPSDSPRRSYLLCKDTQVQIEPVADSLSILKDLLALIRNGLERPIYFFPKSSYEYAEQLVKKSATEFSALQKARRRWLGSDFSDYSDGESNDPYYDLCFRRLDPLDEAFQKNAMSVFKPLLAHSKEIRL